MNPEFLPLVDQRNFQQQAEESPIELQLFTGWWPMCELPLQTKWANKTIRCLAEILQMMYFARTLCGGQQFPATIPYKITWAVRVRRGSVTLSPSQFKHILEDVGHTVPMYNGHLLSRLNHHRRGLLLEKWARYVLQDKYPMSVLKDPQPGTRIDGRSRGLCHAEYDFLLDGRKIEIKSAMLSSNDGKDYFVRFYRTNLQHLSSSSEPKYDDLYLVFFSPKHIFLLKHDLQTGISGSSVIVAGKVGSWEESVHLILDRFCRDGACKLMRKADISDPWILRECERCMGYGAPFYHGKPLSAMTSAMRGYRIEKLVQEIDQQFHPKSEFSRPNRSADWNRDEIRVEVKHSQLCFCWQRRRWYCTFRGLKLGYFDELLLVIYSPWGLEIFRHDGLHRLGNLEAVLHGQSKPLSVQSAPGQVDPLRSLQLIEDKLEAKNCQKVASIVWDVWLLEHGTLAVNPEFLPTVQQNPEHCFAAMAASNKQIERKRCATSPFYFSCKPSFFA